VALSGFAILLAGFAAEVARSMRFSVCASDKVASAIVHIAIIIVAIVTKRRVRVARISDQRKERFFDFD